MVRDGCVCTLGTRQWGIESSVTVIRRKLGGMNYMLHRFEHDTFRRIIPHLEVGTTVVKRERGS